MRRPLKRIALTLLAVGGIVALVLAVVAWRATRVPAWYEQARDQTRDAAEAVIKGRGFPLQNWLARTGATDPAALPEADTSYTLGLTEDDINAVLAMAFDNEHGPLERFRVRLTPGRIDVAALVPDYGRVAGLTAAVDATAGRLPVLRVGGVRLGEQGVPLRWVTAGPLRQVRARLAVEAARGRPVRVDDHGVASEATVVAYYGRLALDLLAGRGVAPLAVLSGRLSGDDLIVTRVSRLDVTEGRLAVTFRLLTAAERAELLAGLAEPLPPP